MEIVVLLNPQLERRSLKKIRASTGFEPVTSANTCAMLYQLSYEAIHWERGQMIEFISSREELNDVLKPLRVHSINPSEELWRYLNVFILYCKYYGCLKISDCSIFGQFFLFEIEIVRKFFASNVVFRANFFSWPTGAWH